MLLSSKSVDINTYPWKHSLCLVVWYCYGEEYKGFIMNVIVCSKRNQNVMTMDFNDPIDLVKGFQDFEWYGRGGRHFSEIPPSKKY